MPDVQRISWVLKKLADGDFTIGFDEDGHREFRFSDVSAETEELEIELFSYVDPEDTAAFDRFVKTRNAETLKEFFKLARSFAKWTLRPTLDDADEVRRKANDAAHEGSPPAETSKELFIKTRGILRELYS